MTELRVIVTARRRAAQSRLDDVVLTPAPADPAIGQLLACTAAALCDRSDLWLGGGEPTLRADLPELIAALSELPGCARIGLCTDGLALVSPRALGPLQGAGLRRVRLALHSSRPEAHDWLVGQAGAGRQVLRAARTCSGAGLAVELGATVTRPAAHHLTELVELAARLEATALYLRRLVARGAAAEGFIMLSPRLRLLEPELAAAAARAAQLGVGLGLEGFPACLAEGLAVRRESVSRQRVVTLPAEPWPELAAALAPPAGLADGWAGCRARPACDGPPPDYLRCFGADELRALEGGAAEPGSSAEAVIVRFGGPALVACPVCGDRGDEPAEPEPTRSIRRRLVRAADQGAATLRLASAASLAHPAAAALLDDCRYLGFARVEVAGEGSALGGWPDEDLRSLGFLARLELALYGPDAARHDAHTGRPGSFAATLRGLGRFTELTGVEAGAYAVLHDPADAAAYAAAWAAGRLPGAPRFRLSPAGGDLGQLAAAVAELPAGAARTALTALLPACLRPDPPEPAAPPPPAPGWLCDSFCTGQRPPSGSDSRGLFAECRCEDGRLRRCCPGVAVGWQLSRGASGPASGPGRSPGAARR